MCSLGLGHGTRAIAQKWDAVYDERTLRDISFYEKQSASDRHLDFCFASCRSTHVLAPFRKGGFRRIDVEIRSVCRGRVDYFGQTSSVYAYACACTCLTHMHAYISRGRAVAIAKRYQSVRQVGLVWRDADKGQMIMRTLGNSVKHQIYIYIYIYISCCDCSLIEMLLCLSCWH